MGRGRAKAKQTRVARELKYHSPVIDLERLRRDLGAASGNGDHHPDEADEVNPDTRAAWADWYADEDADGGARATSR